MRFNIAFVCALAFVAQSAFAASIPELEKEARASSPAKLEKILNSGWGASMREARRALKPGKSYLALHSTEPGMIMDIRSPDAFRDTIVSQALMGEDDIGHVWVSWRCQTSKGPIEGAAGQTGNFDDQFMELLKKGWGLAAFKAHFLDGYVETPALIEAVEFKWTAPFHTLMVEVDDAVCGRAMKFVRDYVHHPNKPHLRYGLEGNPFTFEGGGCGSFGLAVAEVAGLYGQHKVSESFWRPLVANHELFGFGLAHPRDVVPFNLVKEGKKSVSLTRVLSENWNGTDPARDPQLTVMDPEMLLLSMKTIYRMKEREIRASGGERLRKLFEAKGPGNLWNYRATLNEVPAVIDPFFDVLAARTVQATTAWMNDNGFSPRVVWLGKNPAVILDKP